MSETCAKCKEQLEPGWEFCPHCAAPSRHEAETVVHHAPEKAPIKSGLSGMLLGIITAPVLIIYGTLICLMVGPWMVVGVPMIIAGILAPFLGPFIAISAVRGNCPWCGAKISSVGPLNAFYCYACSHRIEVRKRELVKAE